MDYFIEWQPSFFRVIVAGGGTGRDTNYLAEQLNHTNAEIVYMDFSQNSMNIDN